MLVTSASSPRAASKHPRCHKHIGTMLHIKLYFHNKNKMDKKKKENNFSTRQNPLHTMVWDGINFLPEEQSHPQPQDGPVCDVHNKYNPTLMICFSLVFPSP